jgi:hypothetical protein
LARLPISRCGPVHGAMARPLTSKESDIRNQML